MKTNIEETPVEVNRSYQRDDQIRRTARILEIIQQISISPGRWSRATLAEFHEVSERMIQKDLYLIRYRLGLSLIHDGAGYFFERLPHLPTTIYSFSEALALVTAARTAQALPGVNSVELAAAIARLETIFPEELRPLLREATEQLPRKATKTHRQEMLALLHRALVEGVQVKILYSTASRKSKPESRIVEPYYIMPYGRSWHMIAFDHKRGEVLQFKVDRITEAELLEITYFVPRDFDIDEYLGDSWGMMRGSTESPELVQLTFDPQAGRWVAEEQWHKSQQSEILPDGRVKVTFFVGVTPEMINWLLYYGGRVHVDKPKWLREAVREAHRKAAEV
jgi:predicted DNA-binding transcriptional regulator YafY